jgi:hypothetical protein
LITSILNRVSQHCPFKAEAFEFYEEEVDDVGIYLFVKGML